MRRVRAWLLVAAMALGGMPGTALAASEVDILLDKLVDKGVLSGVEAGLIRREIAESKETRNKELAKEIVPSSARNWNWKGDIRLRNEYRNQEGTGNDRNRQRIRFRYGVQAKVSDELKVNARIATGQSSTGGTGGDPVSTNQSFDTNFAKKNVNLDLANLEYSPAVPGVTKVKVIGGMMESPFWSVSPLVFDGDLSFDGAAAQVSQEVGPATIFTNAGAFSLDTDETESASLWIAQSGASVKPFPDEEDEVLKNLKLTGAVAYQDYRNVANAAKAGTDIIARESQNTSGAKDFNQINPSAEIASVVAGVPMGFYGDWVHNVSAGSRNNDGFQVGMKIGKATTPWSLRNGWEAGYAFQELQANATFDEFSDSDINDGGTNNRGHMVWLTLATLKNSTLGAKYIAARNLKGTKDVENRLQLDWVTKF
jgi:hypothetical protein